MPVMNSAPLRLPVAEALGIAALDGDTGNGIAKAHLPLHAGVHRLRFAGAISGTLRSLGLGERWSGEHSDGYRAYEYTAHSSLPAIAAEYHKLRRLGCSDDLPMGCPHRSNSIWICSKGHAKKELRQAVSAKRCPSDQSLLRA